MEELKINISKILLDSPKVDWFIIHKISKDKPNIEGIGFSFVDGIERIDEPFKSNLGYISLKNPSIISEFGILIAELLQEFKFNPIALANIFIITTRVSYSESDKEILIENFKRTIGTKKSNDTFSILTDSLNAEYYKHHHLKDSRPKNTNEWLDLFRATQYFHSISDSLLYILRIVRNERSRKIDFEVIEKMQPLLRSVLIGCYDFHLKITKDKLKSLIKKENELAFLSACLINNSSREMISSDWLTQNLIDIFLNKYWNSIGKYVFLHVFGLSYRNKNNNKLYEKNG